MNKCKYHLIKTVSKGKLMTEEGEYYSLKTEEHGSQKLLFKAAVNKVTISRMIANIRNE